MSPLHHFSLPPLSALSFLPFIFLQGILLHPRIPANISRPLRIILTIPGVYLSAVAPFWWRIEPVEWGVGANFRWGIFGPSFIMKALEWGFAKDRSVYTWIGFDEAEELEESVERVRGALNGGRGDAGVDAKANGVANGHANGHANGNGHSNGNGVAKTTALQREVDGSPLAAATKRLGALSSSEANSTTSLDSNSPSPLQSDGTPKLLPPSVGSTGAPSIIKSSRRSSSRLKDGPIEIVLWTFHLLTSMRGVGYAWGPPKNALGRRPPRDPTQFFFYAIRQFITAHVMATLCLVIIIHQRAGVPQFLQSYFLPFLSLSQIQPIANVLAYLSVGISLGFQMLVGFYGSALIWFTSQTTFHLLLSPLPIPTSLKPGPFDSRSWPAFFSSPHKPKSVTIFWAQQWHHLFRKPFLAVGYEPVGGLVRKLAGKAVGRAVGAFAVFGLSAWMHDQGLWSARYNLDPQVLPLHRPLTFSERWGGCIFFFVQAVAVFLEGVFTRTTKRKVRGVWARLWSYFVIVGVGMLAGRSWIALGLVEGLPTIDHWGWQRWVVPSSALAPPPLWTT